MRKLDSKWKINKNIRIIVGGESRDRLCFNHRKAAEWEGTRKNEIVALYLLQHMKWNPETERTESNEQMEEENSLPQLL